MTSASSRSGRSLNRLSSPSASSSSTGPSAHTCRLDEGGGGGRWYCWRGQRAFGVRCKRPWRIPPSASSGGSGMRAGFRGRGSREHRSIHSGAPPAHRDGADGAGSDDASGPFQRLGQPSVGPRRCPCGRLSGTAFAPGCVSGKHQRPGSTARPPVSVEAPRSKGSPPPLPRQGALPGTTAGPGQPPLPLSPFHPPSSQPPKKARDFKHSRAP